MKCNQCEHQNTVCDSSSGDTVCTECGIVLDSFAFATQCTWDRGCEVVHEARDVVVSDAVQKRYANLQPYIDAVSAALRLPDHVTDSGHHLGLHLVQSSITLRESTMSAFASAVVYQACKSQNVDRSESEFVASGLVTSKALAQANKRIRRELGAFVEHRGTNPRGLVQRFMNLLGADFDSRTLALLRSRTEDILQRMMTTGLLEGRTPECACATCITLAARSIPQCIGEDSFIKLLCNRCGVTPGTIVNTLRTM